MSTQLVQLKRSAVASKVPVVGDLSLGELALNTYDGRVFFKKNPGTESIVEVATLENTQVFTGSKSFSANVGIGTTSPSTALHIKNSSAIVRIEDTDTGVSNIYAELQANLSGSLFISADAANAVAGSAIQFFVDASEKARLTSTGALLIGATVATDRTLSVSKQITGATTAYGVTNNGEIQSDVTTIAYMYRTTPGVAAAAFTLPNLIHYAASQGTIGAGATVTNQSGYHVDGTLIGAGTNVGFNFTGIAAASVTTGKFVYGLNLNQATASGGGTAFNIYSQGTAPNYLAGNLGIGNTAPSNALSVNGTAYFGANVTITSALTANGSVGTAGQVLTSSATGTYWSTVSGGGGATNLSLTSNSSTVSINSDTGTDVIVLAANSTTAGVLTADAQTIGGIKTFNSNTVLATVTAGTWNGTVIGPAYGGTGQTSLNASRTALTGYLAITSSGGTTTLTNTSAEFIYVSGTLGHTIVLPDVTTLALGWSFNVFNSSSLTVTVQSSGLNTIGAVINSGHTVRYICVDTTGTTAASWTASYEGATTRTGGGSTVFNFQPSIGNLTLTGTLTANSGVGTAGQVLTSSATGTYWSTVSGGGGSTATYNVTIGDGTATSFTITHSLAKANIFVSIRDVSTGYFVYPDIKYTSTNAVVLEFVDPPTASQYYVAVIGA